MTLAAGARLGTLALTLALLACPVHAFATATAQLLVAGSLCGGTFALVIVGALIVIYARPAYAGASRVPVLSELENDSDSGAYGEVDGDAYDAFGPDDPGSVDVVDED